MSVRAFQISALVKLVVAGWFFLVAPSLALPVLQNIQQIKQLPSLEAAKKYPVIIEGQVLHFHPDIMRAFIQDGQAGMYVQLQIKAGMIDGLRVGSLVRVDGGRTGAGGFSPVVFSSGMTVLGWKPLPSAKKLNRKLHQSSNVDVEWVEMCGRPISVEMAKTQGYLVVSMEVFDDVTDVFIPYTEDSFTRMASFMFREVCVAGVLGTKANAHHQMTGRILYANAIEDFRLLPEAEAAAPEYVPIHALMKYGKNYPGLVKTRGTIVHSASDNLYLRGDKNSLRASVYQGEQYQPGDIVELTGYAHAQPVSPSFRTVEIEKTGAEHRPEPVDISINGTGIDPDWNNELVSLDAEFMYVAKTFTKRRIKSDRKEYDNLTKESLWCQAGTHVFEAKLPEGETIPEGLRPGSRIRLTGICHVMQNKNPRLDEMIESLWIELAGANSVAIIRRASWWTPLRLLWGLGVALFTCLLFVVWVVALHKTVAAQTNTIGRQIERETLLSERQRIARELHDTLEQGLAALSLQLGRIFNKVRDHAAADLPTVQKAVDTLRVCREESRASIQDLRGGLLEEMDLPSAIRHTLAPRLEETDIKLNVAVEGEMVRLPLFVEHQLVRIVTEAASNAIQHASPSRVSLHLDYGADQVQVVVQDNGSGFDPGILESSGRFGVLGMRERAKRIKGLLALESAEGEGTRITLNVPVENAAPEE